MRASLLLQPVSYIIEARLRSQMHATCSMQGKLHKNHTTKIAIFTLQVGSKYALNSLSLCLSLSIPSAHLSLEKKMRMHAHVEARKQTMNRTNRISINRSAKNVLPVFFFSNIEGVFEKVSMTSHRVLPCWRGKGGPAVFHPHRLHSPLSVISHPLIW